MEESHESFSSGKEKAENAKAENAPGLSMDEIAEKQKSGGLLEKKKKGMTGDREKDELDAEMMKELEGLGIDQKKPLKGEKLAAAKAEIVRLGEEMQNLAKKNAWTGVERAYVKIEDRFLGRGVELPADTHDLAAQAAMEAGDISIALTRLKRAQVVESSSERQDQIRDIENKYGSVSIRIQNGTTGLQLELDDMPMDPIQRKVIEVAKGKIASGENFSGMLPVGLSYMIKDKTFEVSSAYGNQIDIG